MAAPVPDRTAFLTQLLEVTPGGAQTRSKRAHSLPSTFPTSVMSGRGATILGGDGRTYTDWICALGAISLGHDFAHVSLVVHDQIDHGVSFSLPHYVELDASVALLTALKWPEQVRWVKTGSEATAAAMQIARAATGRRRILSIGYHGWHEVHQPSEWLIDLKWGNYQDLHYGFIFGPPVAAVLLEPVRDMPPTAAEAAVYLGQVRDLCTKKGALLIMDEVLTGFRWAVGGASEHFGIQPDLACYGKGMANGYPLACVVGMGRHMAFAHDVSGTFGGEALSLAATHATLAVYRREPVIAHMWRIGQRLIDAGVAEGYPCHPRLTGDAMAQATKAATRGHLFHPLGFNVSYSHTEADADDAIEALR